MRHSSKRLVSGSLFWMLLAGGLTFLVSCPSQRNAPSLITATNAPVVEPGVGIPGALELGMLIGEAQKKRCDLVVTKQRRNRRPWPFGKVDGYKGVIEAHGITVQVDASGRIGRFAISVDPQSASNRFLGSLSSGFSFSHGRILRRSDVVEIFGKPPRVWGSNTGDFWKAWKSFAWTPDESLEILYYLPSGITFRLEYGVVDAMEIMPRGTNWPPSQSTRTAPNPRK